jgi:hypothetical protein
MDSQIKVSTAHYALPLRANFCGVGVATRIARVGHRDRAEGILPQGHVPIN